MTPPVAETARSEGSAAQDGSGAAQAAPALSLARITKTFGGFTALDDVSFSLMPGEVHALLGENGAGKSTLMNVAAGLYMPDSGTIAIRGQTVSLPDPSAAHRHGIGMVHQHYKLVGPFTALENIQLENGHGPYAASLARLRARAGEVAGRIGFAVDLDARVEEMSVSAQQRVEILRILTADASIIILDEPTAVLTDIEADALFAAMRNLAASGHSVVFVTHKLREALAYADRITVMRAGRVEGTVEPGEVDAATLTTMIVGERLVERPHRAESPGPVRLKVRGLAHDSGTGQAPIRDVNFDVRAGEIYGIAGVGGNGQNRLVALLTGLAEPDAGTAELEGTGDIARLGPRRLRALGIATIHSDRASYGLAGPLPVADNLGVAGVLAGRYGSAAWVDRGRMRADAAAAARDFDVRGLRSPQMPTGLLSGGNAQKLVLAREFSRTPSVVIAHSPCRGLDVRAAAAVHEHLRAARDRGGAVILLSEDLDEILLMADRIGVMRRVRIVAEFTAPADRRAIGEAMTGHD